MRKQRDVGRSAHPQAGLGVPPWFWALLLIVFPGVVAFHAWRTVGMLDDQRDLYLRGRIAALTVRVESLAAPAGADDPDWAMALYDEEPSLVDAALVSASEPDAAAVEIYAGRELYRMEKVRSGDEDLLRAWFPVHRGGRLEVVRLDFSARAADFLTDYATQSIALVAIIAAALMALSAYTFRLAGKAAQLERRQAEREHLARLGEMAAVLAHEIRNPLGGIKGFGQLLQETVQEPERTYAGEIVEQSGRLERLVEDLLRFGRVPEPRMATVGWNEIAERLERSWLLEARRETAGSPAVSLAVERHGVVLATDAALLEQALGNLVRNAHDAAASRGEGQGELPQVTVRVGVEDGRVSIKVEDNGAGLSEEARERLFEPFFTTKAFGTGLGLATTRRFADVLGGELLLEDRLGGGLIATIRLPMESGRL